MIPKAITEDLQNGMGLEECLIKHETNLQTLFSKELIPRDYSEETRYIEKKGNRFYIKKKIGNKTPHFGIYSSLEDAQLVRDKLICTGWKQNQVDNICKEVGVNRIPGRNESRFCEVKQ